MEEHPHRTLIEVVNGREIFYDDSLMVHGFEIRKKVRVLLRKRPEYHRDEPPPEERITPTTVCFTGTLDEMRALAESEEENGVMDVSPNRREDVDEGV